MSSLIFLVLPFFFNRFFFKDDYKIMIDVFNKTRDQALQGSIFFLYLVVLELHIILDSF
jgi:hypothetical protein